jgi:hypothetical protein
LYGRYAYDRIFFFSCRKCAGIAYQSTMGHRWDRSARRIEKLRSRLAWGAHGPCRSSREACRRERTDVFWGCWRTMRPCETRGRVTLEITGQISLVPICGGNPK